MPEHMKVKHTPGPWVEHTSDLRPYGAMRWVHDEDFGDIALVLAPNVAGEFVADEVRANARLMAAAPDLLAALARALRDSGCDGDLCAYAWHEEARAAIAKATGGEG